MSTSSVMEIVVGDCDHGHTYELWTRCSLLVPNTNIRQYDLQRKSSICWCRRKCILDCFYKGLAPMSLLKKRILCAPTPFCVRHNVPSVSCDVASHYYFLRTVAPITSKEHPACCRRRRDPHTESLNLACFSNGFQRFCVHGFHT